MESGRRQRDEDVPGDNGAAVDDVRAPHLTDDEPGEVVFAIGVEAGHLRGLAAEQRAAVFLAGRGDAGDDLLGDIGREPARCEVVEEEQRPRALNQDVVDAVIDEIAPIVSCTPAMNATFSLVPTPSALATSTGSGDAGSSANRPPNDPTPDSTPGVYVPRASTLIRRTTSLPASMSTPDWR